MRTLMLALAVTAICRAQPPVVVQSQAGGYEIESCAGLGEEVWLGGSQEHDGFLTRLGADGRALWQRRFGGEGEDAVEGVAPLAGGAAVVVGHCHSELTSAWAGQAKLDWQRQAFVARVGAQGDLLASLDVRAASGKAIEPSVKLRAVAARHGQIWVGGRLEGDLWGLSSAAPQAFVARLDQDLKPVQATLLDGYEVTQLQAGAQGCLAAGVRKGEQEQVVLWTVGPGGTTRESFAGRRVPSAACRQLEPDHLVYEEEARVFQLDLPRGENRPLPEGVWATVAWQGDQWALGQANHGLTGTTSVGEGDLVLWRLQGAEWRPAWRFGTRRSDFFRFLVVTANGLTLAGRSRGAFPGQAEAPADQDRASWIRLFRVPEGDDAAMLGVRAPQATRDQLSGAFQDLSYQPRPGYDHFSGWLPDLRLGLVSRESSPFDHWVCLSQDGQEVSQWGPPKNLPAPLEPQIFPLLSQNQVVCLSPGQGAEWFRLDAAGKIAARQTLRRPQGLLVEQIAAGSNDCLWAGREFTRKGQQRRMLGLLNAQGGEAWCVPLQGWSQRGAACLSLARDGEFSALLLEDAEKCHVQGLKGARSFFRLEAPGQPQALAWVAGQLWLAAKLPDRLVLHAYDRTGKSLWSKALGHSADFQISQILPIPTGATLVGSRQNQVGAQGLLLEVDSHGGEKWRWTPACDRDLLLKRARIDAAGQLWVGGEIVEDYETDVFWGRPRR